MSKLSLSVYLNAYSDPTSSNAPGLNNFKWSRDLNSLPVSNPSSIPFTVAPGETKSIFSGVRSLAQDGTTQYSLALKPLTSNTYTLSAVAGTLPNFRTPRSTGADATTQVTAVTNGPIVTFTSTAGTNFNLSAVQVGDSVFLGNLFNQQNQGAWQIIAKTATSFTVENPMAVNEGPITLGSGFAAQVQIYSAAGVQVGDTLVISAGFSLASQGSYKVTAVYANSLEFYSTDVLPQESSILAQVAIYSNAKSFIYIEADSSLNVIVNGVNIGNILPFVVNSASLPSALQSVVPGVFMLNSTVYSLSVVNNGLNPSNAFFASVE